MHQKCEIHSFQLRRLLLGLSALFSGCAVGPRYSKPPATVPQTYKEVPENWKSAQPSDQIARGKWWEIFQDPQLNSLEEKVNVSNQSLKASLAQFEQARALIRFYRADYYPTVTAGTSDVYSRVSQNRAVASAFSKTNYNDLTLPISVSWEPDFFGRVRHRFPSTRPGMGDFFKGTASASPQPRHRKANSVVRHFRSIKRW